MHMQTCIIENGSSAHVYVKGRKQTLLVLMKSLDKTETPILFYL